MRIKLFGRKMSDVLKLVAYMEKEGVEYELLTDTEIGIADANATSHADPEIESAESAGPKMIPTVEPVRVTAPTGLWRAAMHDNIMCTDTTCLNNTHQGAQPVGA